MFSLLSNKLPFIYRDAGSGKLCGPLSSEKLKHVNRPLKAKGGNESPGYSPGLPVTPYLSGNFA